jgi:hypothetical protein
MFGGESSASSDSLLPFGASGIVGTSLPAFLDKDETISVIKKGSGANTYWTLTGSGSDTSFLGGMFEHVKVSSALVSYQANFNSAGQLITSIPAIGSTPLSNYLEINGSLKAGTSGGTSWAAQPNELLLKADLLDKNPGNGTPDRIGTLGDIAIGFNTKFTGGWAPNNPGLTGGSTGESLWLIGLSSKFEKLVHALDGNPDNGTFSSLFASSTIIKGVASFTAVPLTGAVWLFGAVLMGFLARSKFLDRSTSLHVV